MKVLTTLLLALPGLALGAGSWTPERMIEGALLTSATPSPDGRSIAYVVSSPVMTDDESTYRGVIYVAAGNGKSERRFTFGKQSASNPAWSPDGRWLAYMRSTEGKANLFVIAADGGGARQLTSLETGVAGFKWAPDSARIAYLAQAAEDEEEAARKKAKDDAITVDADYRFQHLWLVGLPDDAADDAPEPTQLTRGEFQVSPGYAPGFDWDPDGSRIAFSHTPTPELNDWTRADISSVDVTSGEVSAMQTTLAAEYAPTFSPDGSRLAFVRTMNPASWMRDARVAVADLGSGDVRQLAATPDENPQLLGWSSSSTLMVGESIGTRRSLLKLPANGNAPVTFAEPGLISNAALNHSGNSVALVVMDSSSPEEVFVSRTGRYSPTRVSNVNAARRDLAVGPTEVIRWQAPDELEIEGLLTYPTGYRAGTRVPLLLVIHGGPAGTHGERFVAHPTTLYPTAAFAAGGYAVLRANPRGSGGYGADFRRANRNDWGGMDFQDLMSGVDKVISMGVADPDRLGVMGWSYGGFMTSWVITHTNRFKAASIGAPVTDLIAFNGTADITDFLPDYFSGEFWDRREVYLEHSPLMHVDNASTPSLIQHGQADLRVPLGQGTAFYRALKRRGVETRMVIYPRAPHGPREPRQRLDIMKDNLDWFEKHIPANAG